MTAVHDKLPPAAAAERPAGSKRTPIYIVCSPRPQVGKTMAARLLVDFKRIDDGAATGFDLNPPTGTGLIDYQPESTRALDIGDTRGQIEVFDRLIVADGMPKIVDLGVHAFNRFFALLEEIDFVDEAHRRSIEMSLLFVVDGHSSSSQAYAQLIGRFPDVMIVPVFNEGIGRMLDFRHRFPITRGAGLPIVIRRLPPQLKVYIENRGYSFADFDETVPVEVPMRLALELRSWTKRTFLEFRELELRLLMQKLKAALVRGDEAATGD